MLGPITFSYLFLPLLTFAYLCLPFLTFSYLFLPFLTFAYLLLTFCLPLLTFPYLCLPFLTSSYPSLPFLTFAYLFFPYSLIEYMSVKRHEGFPYMARCKIVFFLQFSPNISTKRASNYFLFVFLQSDYFGRFSISHFSYI